jgi:hypothetical protein
VEEMPAMNKIVKAFVHRNDIVFLSLALDDEKNLKEFLSKKVSIMLPWLIKKILLKILWVLAVSQLIS